MKDLDMFFSMILRYLCSSVWIVLISMTLWLACLHVGSFHDHWLTDLLQLAIHGKVQSLNSKVAPTREHTQQGNALWKKFFALQVKKSLFTHMYVVGFISGLLCLYQYLVLGQSEDGLHGAPIFSYALLIMSLYIVQVFRRLLECLFITDYGAAEMHVGAYLVGILHYIFVPLTLITSSASIPESLSYDSPRILASLLLFGFGNYFQYRHHRILWRLKQTNHGAHAIPRGLFFEYVCCPHYTMEILVYLSFYLFCPTWSTLLLLLWVISNLSLVASVNLSWYRNHFPSSFEKEHKHWRRIIPFIW
jgi:3-oxo-5-alpha-steroid 4-dehydrogenase 3 / polyprenol reductase